MKNKIIEAISQGIKNGLLESGFNFSLDNLENIENMGLKKKKLNRDFFKDEFDRQQDQYEKITFLPIIDKILNEQTLSDKEKDEFNRYSSSLIGIYPVYENHLLRKLIVNTIQIFGNKINLNWIDTSNLNDLKALFQDLDFNGDISKWDVSHVTNMESLFFYNTSFNGDISSWIVSNVTNMNYMFEHSIFNGDISRWDVSKVNTMIEMFLESDFNGDISKWNTHNVKSLRKTFFGAKNVIDISEWDLSSCTDFVGAYHFQQRENINQLKNMFEHMSVEKNHINKNAIFFGGQTFFDQGGFITVSQINNNRNSVEGNSLRWRPEFINDILAEQKAKKELEREEKINGKTPYLEKLQNNELISKYYTIRLSKVQSIRIENEYTRCKIELYGGNLWEYRLWSRYRFGKKAGKLFFKYIEPDYVLKIPMPLKKYQSYNFDDLLQHLMAEPYFNCFWNKVDGMDESIS